MDHKSIHEIWKLYAVENGETIPGSVRPIIRESWKRSRELGVSPFRTGCLSVSEEDVALRKRNRTDLREAAVPYIENLYKIIRGSGSLITLTDEEGIVLDVLSDEDIREMQNFPSPGTIHSERAIGTSGIGTALVTGEPLQILAEEHWLQSNHTWSCNSSAIHRNSGIIGCLCLSCPSLKSHEHSLGLIVASVQAIERELDLTATLREKQSLVNQQKTILELVDTGIILINSKGIVLQTNKMANDILGLQADWIGHHISEVIPENVDFMTLISNGLSLNDQEIPLRLKNKHNYLRFSTETIRNGRDVEAIVIKVQEPRAVLRMVNRIVGSHAVYTFKDIVGKSSELIKCISFARMANRKNANVLLLGDSGTGKELFAQAIHNDSSRRNGPFVAINCGALSRELIQSELFGYVGGAFTGAKREGNPGKFELAEGGTLFLDEIGELPLDAQVNLLRVLQTGEVTRIGAKHAKTIDVRVITATNKDLYSAVESKVFRDDLFYRINTFALRLPSLRERRSDIRILADTFLNRFSQEIPKRSLRIQEEVHEIFEGYSWPGNIRELENVIERAVAVAESDCITVNDLPANLQALCSGSADSESAPSRRESEDRTVKEQELERLFTLIEETGGNLREVARRMGIARSTVYYQLNKRKIPVKTLRKPSSRLSKSYMSHDM